MKLAEALLLRSEYQQKSENLRNRILQNLKTQEGEPPHEDPNLLLLEFEEISSQLTRLIKQIHRTNALAILPDGRTLGDALIDRDDLLKSRQLLSTIVENANEADYRLTRTEIKMTVTVSIADFQKKIDQLSKAFRQLDTQIQGINWTVELAE